MSEQEPYVSLDSDLPCPYVIPPPSIRTVHLRTNPADIGADTIAAICRWYTFGNTVHSIVRKINNRRAVTDTVGMIDVYAILAKKIEQGILSSHDSHQLAKDELTPVDFTIFYELWKTWKGERWMRENLPAWNHLAIRNINRALNARHSTEKDNVEENAKELIDAKEEEQAIDKENEDTVTAFAELERKHPILTIGKRVIASNKPAYLIYSEDIDRFDRISSMNLYQREKLKIEEIETEEILVKPEEWMTTAEKEKRFEIEETQKLRIEESLPLKRSKEECEAIDTFASGFNFDFSDSDDEVWTEGEKYIEKETEKEIEEDEPKS